MNKESVVESLTDSDEVRLFVAARQRELSQVQYERDQLCSNVKRHEENRAIYESHIAALKKQIVNLQAELLVSQDRVSELQQMLLDRRAGRTARPGEIKLRARGAKR